MTQPRRSFASAVLAFLVLPGTIGFVFPLLLRADDAAFDPRAIPVLVVGIVLLLWCVRDFYVAGRGTLAPWAPPFAIVTVGLYRFSRNPMYVSVATILCGWALAYHSRALWAYAAIVTVAFHFRVILHEEPWLERTFHREWMSYRATVPRWVGLPRRSGAIVSS